jgi:prepilin peptidase CpaA
MVLDLARLLFFPALMAFAAASDLFTMTISNKVSLLLAAGFLVLAFAGGMTTTEMGWHLAAAGAVLAVTFGMFAMGWIGGGDAKLTALIALWLGFDQLLLFLVYASVFGGALTLFIIQFRLWPLPYALGTQPWVQRLHKLDNGVPYGIALAMGAMMVYPDTIWMRAVDLSRFISG